MTHTLAQRIARTSYLTPEDQREVERVRGVRVEFDKERATWNPDITAPTPSVVVTGDVTVIDWTKGVGDGE